VSIYRKGWQEQVFGRKQHIKSIHLMRESIQTASQIE